MNSRDVEVKDRSTKSQEEFSDISKYSELRHVVSRYSKFRSKKVSWKKSRQLIDNSKSLFKISWEKNGKKIHSQYFWQFIVGCMTKSSLFCGETFFISFKNVSTLGSCILNDFGTRLLLQMRVFTQKSIFIWVFSLLGFCSKVRDKLRFYNLCHLDLNQMNWLKLILLEWLFMVLDWETLIWNFNLSFLELFKDLSWNYWSSQL